MPKDEESHNRREAHHAIPVTRRLTKGPLDFDEYATEDII